MFVEHNILPTKHRRPHCINIQTSSKNMLSQYTTVGVCYKKMCLDVTANYHHTLLAMSLLYVRLFRPISIVCPKVRIIQQIPNPYCSISISQQIYISIVANYIVTILLLLLLLLIFLLLLILLLSIL